MPSASNTLVERTRNRFRSRPLQAATGALALLAITYSIYTWSISGSDRGGNNGRGGSTSQGSNDEAGNSAGNAGEASGKDSKSSSNQRNLNRPTLSLSFPPSFNSLDPTHLSHLKMILSVLSTSFLISLIVPIPSISSHLEPQDQAGEEENQDDDDDLFENIEDSTISSKPTPSIALPTDLTLESIDNLAFELSRIDHFDTRRILEYSSDKGRAALSRSLKSDAHVEVLLSPSTEHSQTSNHSEVSSKDKKRSENKETRLKEYKPLLELLRKSSGLIVFLVLPSPPSTSTGTSSDRSELDLSTEAVLGPFGSGVHIPGIRVFDLRERSVPGRRSSRSSCGKSSLKDEGDEGLDGEREDQAVVGEEEESEETEAWREGAERIKALRKGWR